MKIILKIVFSNLFLIFLLITITIFLFCRYIYYLREYFIYLFLFFQLLNFILIIYILNKRQDPAYHISWLTLVLLFPGVGLLIYLFLNLPLTTIKTKDKLIKLRKETIKYLKQNNSITSNLEDNEKIFINYMYNYGNFPIYNDNKSEYFSDGISFFEDFLEEIRKAKKTIFLEFYLIEKGIMWDRLLEILKEKVKEKVEVRILYDGMCSICLLPSYYPKKLNKMGIKCKIYSPIKNIISTYQNHRDHRKISIIDGKIAYIGGINIGDNYIHVKNKYGYWKDSAVKIKGESVKTFIYTYLEMCNLNEKILKTLVYTFLNILLIKKKMVMFYHLLINHLVKKE